MSEELENSVREMLKAETWTRAGITNFTKNNIPILRERKEHGYKKYTKTNNKIVNAKCISKEKSNLANNII